MNIGTKVRFRSPISKEIVEGTIAVIRSKTCARVDWNEGEKLYSTDLFLGPPCLIEILEKSTND